MEATGNNPLKIWATILVAALALTPGCSAEEAPGNTGGGGFTILPDASSNLGGGGADAGNNGGGGSVDDADNGGGGGGDNDAGNGGGGDNDTGNGSGGGGGDDDAGNGGGGDNDAGNGGGGAEDTWTPPEDPKCVDDDGDGYGENCVAGPDCDDYNPNFNELCPDCASNSVKGCPCGGQQTTPCFSGDPALVGVGICKAGVRTCEKGFWGACTGQILPKGEICQEFNPLDDDCDGQTDEGVKSSCGNCDANCYEQGIGPTEGKPFDIGNDNAKGVNTDQNGYVILDAKNYQIKHIWIANSPQNTVSKLSTVTGEELGRYAVCNNPSRTAVDLEGNVYVGCRSDGHVAKILADTAFCPDKNGNGSIETSLDTNGDKKVTGGEVLPLGSDECMVYNVKPVSNENTVRGVGVDKNNEVWLGMWNTQKLVRIASVAGNTVQEVNLGARTYGLVIDQKGIIWVAGRSPNALLRYDPVSGQISQYSPPSGIIPYGISVDQLGKVWVGNFTKAKMSRFDPDNNSWWEYNIPKRARGVAASNDGFVFLANDQSHNVAVFDATGPKFLYNISLGGGSKYPVGLAMDFDGFLWAVNQQGVSASKIDYKNKQVIGEYPVGASPYTYSDMTGYALNNFTAPKGYYRQTFLANVLINPISGEPPVSTWTEVNVDAEYPPGSTIEVKMRVGDSLDELKKAAWVGPFATLPNDPNPIELLKLNIPPFKGAMAEVQVDLKAASDKSSPKLKGVSAKSIVATN